MSLRQNKTRSRRSVFCTRFNNKNKVEGLPSHHFLLCFASLALIFGVFLIETKMKYSVIHWQQLSPPIIIIIFKFSLLNLS